MKTLKLLALIILPIFGFTFFSNAQKNIEPTSSTEIIRKGIIKHDNGDYEDAVDEYFKISINDSLYGLAQYEAALSLIELKENKEAIDVLNDILLYQPRYDYKNLVYSLLGTAYDNDEQSEKAIEVYKEGLVLFPTSHDLYYNLGVTYQKVKKYPEAVQAYQNALIMNPDHAASYLRLGLMAANEEEYALSIVLLTAFLTYEGVTERALATISTMEKIANGSFDPESVEYSFGESAKEFSDINLLIKNKVALGKGFKSGLKPATDYGKQYMYIGSLFDEMKFTNFDNFYIEHLRRFITFSNPVVAKKMRKSLFLYSLRSFDNYEVQKAIQKDSKNVTMLAQNLDPNVYKFKDAINIDGSTKDYMLKYNDNNRLSQIVPVAGADKSSFAYEFFNIGSIRYKIKCNDESKFDCFNANGGLTDGSILAYNHYNTVETANLKLKGSQVDGVTLYNYPTGELKYKKKFVNGQLIDTTYQYYRSGDLYEKYALKNDLRNGQYVTFYPNGQLNYKMNYKDGKADGEFVQYFPNGKLGRTFQTINDKIEGEYINYYDNGQIEEKYIFRDGEKNGPYEKFYKNGKLKEKGVYKNNKTADSFEQYSSNGVLILKGNFDESGKETGVTTEYDIDGLKLFEFTYKKGELINITSYAKDGSQIKSDKKSGKNLKYELQHPNGVVSVKGQMVDDIKDGEWLYYDTYGNLSGKTTYRSGLIVDTNYTYYANGKLDSKAYYRNGERNGLYLKYDINGELIEEGMYNNGYPNGDYYIYRSDGRMKYERFYYDGDYNGIAKEYAVNGKLDSWSEYDRGREIEHIFLDTNENIVQKFGEYNGFVEIKDAMATYVKFSATYKNGEADGPATWYYGKDQVEIKGSFLNGSRDGKWVYYFPNGKIDRELTYSFGDLEGDYKRYYDNGKLAFEGVYDNNELQGAVKRYRTNGELEMEDNYLDDERHGRIVYHHSGEISMIRYYRLGELLSYSYIGKDGSEVTPIPITKGKNEIVTYFKNGIKASEHVRENGLIEGDYIIYGKNGKILEKSTYKNGDLNGKVEEYNDNGNLIESADYLYDEYHGTVKTYYKNGQLKSETKYLYGDKNGNEKLYSEDGKLIKTYVFYNDELIGTK